MASTVVSLSTIIFLGSMSASCQAAPLRQTISGNSSSVTTTAWPRSIQDTPKFFFTRPNQEVPSGFLWRLNRLEDKLKRISAHRLDSVIDKVHKSLSSIMRLKDIFRPSNDVRHSSPTPSQPRPHTRLTGDSVNVTNSSNTEENTTRSDVTETTTTSEGYEDGDDEVAVTNTYEAYIDELIRGGFADFENTTKAPSKEHINSYLKVDTAPTRGDTDSTKHSNPNLRVEDIHKGSDTDSTGNSNPNSKVVTAPTRGHTDSTKHSNPNLKVEDIHKGSDTDSTGNSNPNSKVVTAPTRGHTDSTKHSNPNLKVEDIHKGSDTDSTGNSNPNSKVVTAPTRGHTDSTKHSNSNLRVEDIHKGSDTDSTENSNPNLKVDTAPTRGDTDSAKHGNQNLKVDTTPARGHTDSEIRSNPNLKADGAHKNGTANATESKGFVDVYDSSVNRKDVREDGPTEISNLQKNTTSDAMKMKEPTVNEEFHDTRKHPEDIISFNTAEDNIGDVIEEDYVMTNVLVKEEFRILTTSVQESAQERPNTTVHSDILKRLFTPVSNTGKPMFNVNTPFASEDCKYGSCNEHHLNVSTVISGNSTHILQRIIKTTETRPHQYSDLSKLYVKRQTPDVLAFTSELTRKKEEEEEEEDSDETAAKYDYRDDYDDETKQQGQDGKQSAGDIYGLQNSDNTYVASMKNTVNFTREIELLDRTVGFYATTILELLPHVREGYLNNKFTDKEIETFKNMFGSMWTLINNTELIDNITRLSNITDSEANEDIARAFREAEANGDRTLVRKTRSVSGDGSKSNKRHRHSSRRKEDRKRSQRRKQTRTKSKEHESKREPNNRRRKSKRKRLSEQLSARSKRIDRSRSRRRPRSHSIVNATSVSEAAAILALLAEDGGSIQLDAPEEDDYDEAYDYTYDDDYVDGGDQDYYRDEAGEAGDTSSELARYYSNNDDPSIRELISLASRHKDRKAKLKEGIHEAEKKEMSGSSV